MKHIERIPFCELWDKTASHRRLLDSKRNTGRLHTSRNYTLYIYKDIFSSLTFLVDIMQILFFVILLVLLYIRHVIRDTKVINIFLIICAICIFVNFWLFLANFYFLKLEGLKVFIFWFINNLSNVTIFGLYFTAPILAAKIYENKN